MKMKLTMVILTLILAGCWDEDACVGPGAADFAAPLCGDYHLIRSSAHQVTVSPMAYGYSTPVIPPEVVEVGHDKRFIIAKQNILRRRSPSDPQDTYMEPVPDNFQYWILDSSRPQVYGPLTAAAFDDKRRELGVPTGIAMKDVYAYSPQNKGADGTR